MDYYTVKLYDAEKNIIKQKIFRKEHRAYRYLIRKKRKYAGGIEMKNDKYCIASFGNQDNGIQ